MNRHPAGNASGALRPLSASERRALARAFQEAPSAARWEAPRCQAVLQQLGRRIVEGHDLSAETAAMTSFAALVLQFYGAAPTFDARAELLERITIMLNILQSVGMPRAARWSVGEFDAQANAGLHALLRHGLDRAVWTQEWQPHHWGQPNYLLPGMQPLVHFVVMAMRGLQAPAERLLPTGVLPTGVLEVGAGRGFLARELHKALRRHGCRVFTSDLAWLRPLPYLNADLRLDERLRGWQLAGPQRRRGMQHPLADPSVFVRDADAARAGPPYHRPYHRHVNASCEALPYRAGALQAVVAAFVLSYTDAARAVAECARLLAPGGALLLLCHHPASIKSRVQHDLATRHLPLLRVLGALEAAQSCAADHTAQQTLDASLQAALATALPATCRSIIEELQDQGAAGAAPGCATLRPLARRLLRAATSLLFPFAPFDDADAIKTCLENAGLRLTQIHEVTTAWEVNRAWGVVATKGETIADRRPS